MISWKDLYTVLTAVIPLYVAMILAFGSVRWWKIFTPDQCSGINRFVAIFAVPLLSFHFISTNNPYAMNLRFIAADTLQKILILVILFLWASLSNNGSLEWTITIFSVSTLPNTLVMGIPLLKAMYDSSAGSLSPGSLMVQIVVLQCIIWYTLLLFLFEYRAAKLLILEQFPDTAASIVSFKVDSDVVSLDGRDFLQTEAEVGDDGKLHVTVRKSTSSRRSISGMTPRPSNLTGAEIYSLSSSRNPTPRGSNFNYSDFFSGSGGGRMSNFGQGEVFSVGPTPRPSNFEEGVSPRFGFYPAQGAGYPAPNPEIAAGAPKNVRVQQGSNNKGSHDAKELHMFVWSSSASPVSEGGGLHVFGGSDFGGNEQGGRSDGAKEIRMIVSDHPQPEGQKGMNVMEREELRVENFGSFGSKGMVGGGDEAREKEVVGGGPAKMGSNSIMDLHLKGAEVLNSGIGKQMPPASVMTRLILIMVWRKLIRNPNTYSSLIGLIWSLVAFRWNVSMPKIIEKSISILSDAGLGMAMFSLARARDPTPQPPYIGGPPAPAHHLSHQLAHLPPNSWKEINKVRSQDPNQWSKSFTRGRNFIDLKGLFMALQPKIIACGNSVAAFTMAVRFLTGPAVMAAASIAVGLRGTLLRIAIVQAALPQGIVPFVFAKEYNVHPAILSTGVIFGMLIALPITLVYYIFLGL